MCLSQKIKAYVDTEPKALQEVVNYYKLGAIFPFFGHRIAVSSTI